MESRYGAGAFPASMTQRFNHSSPRLLRGPFPRACRYRTFSIAVRERNGSQSPSVRNRCMWRAGCDAGHRAGDARSVAWWACATVRPARQRIGSMPRNPDVSDECVCPPDPCFCLSPSSNTNGSTSNQPEPCGTMSRGVLLFLRRDPASPRQDASAQHGVAQCLAKTANAD